MIIEILITVFCLLIGLLAWNTFNVPKGLPPGPIALPLLGNVFQIGYKPHLRLSEWSKKYGPIYRIKLGTKDAVVVTDHKMLKELFSDNASSGRATDNPVVYEFSKGPNGVVNGEGSTWAEQRRFTIRTLKEVGFEKTSMEVMILDEVCALMDWLRKSQGKPISGNRIFNAPVVNSLWRILSGERCDWENTRPQILNSANAFFSSLLEVSIKGILFAPMLRFIAPDYLGWNRFRAGVDKMFKLIEESIRTHRETFEPTNLRDFIDHYLLEIENTTDPDSSFYKHGNGHINMVSGLFDLFAGGYESTSGTLSWAILYLGHYQKIQRKLQKEINQVIGSRWPTLSDRLDMPYTEAVILEVLRMSSILGMGVPHRMTENKMFHGHFLPKGMAIFGNTYGIHHDPDVWGDPENFRPERFLSVDETKVMRHHEALLPFSEGKRKCIAKTLAKNTLFLFTVSIFQQFYISLSIENGKSVDFEPQLGYILVPNPFKVVLSSRGK